MKLLNINIKKNILCIILLGLFSIGASAQSITQVNGIITDEKTGERLPFVSVVFPGKSPVGVYSELDGTYVLRGIAEKDVMQVILMGYIPIDVKIKRGVNQVINVRLKPQSETLEAAVVSAKRTKYSNKNNPAVDLVRKVIANKDNNRIESHEYYQYDKYEKLELGLNNFFVDSTHNKGAYKRLRIIFDHLDSSEITGQKVLPVFFKEASSTNYYRKSPEDKKEYINASRMIDIHQLVNMESVENYVTDVFGNVNVYDNEIMLFDNKYMGPLSPFAPNYYRFHIMDTLMVDDVNCIQLGFFPRNEGDFGFRGNIYITTDSTYAIKQSELRMAPNANVNFIRNFILLQNFKLQNSTWCLNTNNATLEFVYASGDKRSILAQRMVSYKDYVFDEPQPNSIYRGTEKIIKLPDYDARPIEYWTTLRHQSLTEHEEGIFSMVDSIKKVPIVKHALNLLGIVFSGYLEMGKFDMGPIISFASFNSLEGLRVRFGGKTNGNFNQNWFFEMYGAYGFKDKEFKYNGTAMYSFLKKKQNPWEYPMNLLKVSYQYDVKIPGQAFLYGSGDKLFLSFIRGEVDKINYERKFELLWTKENTNGFSFEPSFTWLKTYPMKNLEYVNGNNERFNHITTSVFGLFLRFAPNERFFQIQENRFPLNQTEPIVELGHKLGISDLLGGKYTYNRTDVTFYKRWWIGGFGYADTWLKAGKVWNSVPYPLLITPQANQAYAYQDEAYNMMNYMEFVTDQYVSANISYGFNGFIANRIPLVRKLKLREFVTFKIFWGTLEDKNKPENNPLLFRFPMKDGQPSTFALNGRNPYMEISVAIDNIFKFLRIDLIKRLNYLDNPNIPVWGIRFRLRPAF
ncbi:MAG: DUF5686 family protein [Prevotellaceae bacterium]|jgi:hypothetical protein|nr:DUF5686 family protein [Prevotellaceae bacterium]